MSDTNLYELLIDACKHGNLDVVQSLYTNDVDIHQYNNLALRYAIREEHYDIVKYICEHGAVLPEYDPMIVMCVNHRNLPMVKYLCEIFDEPSIKDMALCAAISEGELKIIDYLCTTYFDNATSRTDLNLQNCTTMAIEKGYLDVIQYLYEHHFDMNIQNDLNAAATLGYLHIVKYLHSIGANIDIDNGYILIKCADEGHFDIVKYLCENGVEVNINALCDAIMNRNNDIAKYLYERIPHDSREIYNHKALRSCVKANNFPMLEYLCSVGVDIHADDDSALQLAAINGQLDIVYYLCELGADIHVKNDIVLISAVYHGHTEIVKYLVERGANIHVQYEFSVFEYSRAFLIRRRPGGYKEDLIGLVETAVRNNDIDIVRCLLQSGAQITFDLNKIDIPSDEMEDELFNYCNRMTKTKRVEGGH